MTLHRAMLLIRRTEERIATLIEEGEIKTPCHLYIGQEAIAVGVCAALKQRDSIWGGHRSHGHYLAKGGDLNALMAEIYSKATGCSKGRGGSMHLLAPEVGLFGTVPIVGATIPLAVGAALATKMRGEDGVAVSFFGDGATEEGHFHESLNLAALYRLPIVLVCENNFYSTHMALADRRAMDNIVRTAELYGMPGVREDGNDVLAVYESARQAVARAREQAGPTLLEYRTYRWRGHVGPAWDLEVGHHRRQELAEWLPKDPIERVRRLIMDGEGRASSQVLDRQEEEIGRDIEAAVAFARHAPPPDSSELHQHVYGPKG